MSWYKAAAAFVLPIIVFSSCHNNGERSRKELIEHELQLQAAARNGNKDPQVEVITDPARLKQLRESISNKMVLARKTQAARVDEQSVLVKRFKAGDQAVIPLIAAVLQGKDAEKKRSMYNELGKKWDDPDTYTITAPSLVTAILAGVERPEEEEDAIQLAGICAIPGYRPVFEKMLLSGKSKDEGRLVYWLSKEGSSTVTLNYIDQRIRAGAVSGAMLNEFVSSLDNFGEKGSTAVRKKVGDLAIYIYENKLLGKDAYLELKKSVMTSDAAEYSLRCICKYGDRRAIPIIRYFVDHDIRPAEAVMGLIRLEGTQHLKLVYKYLGSKDEFFDGLSMVEAADSSLRDAALLSEVLIQLDKQATVGDHIVKRIVDDYKGFHAQSYLEHPEKLVRNGELAARIKATYERSNIPVTTIVDDLLAAGLLHKRPDAATLKQVVELAEGEPASIIYDLLGKNNVLVSFDTEADEVPVPYDSLLYNFAGHSGGVLKDVLVWMDAEELPDDHIGYAVTVVSGDKAFVIRPEELEDWYDVALVDALIEKLLAEKGTKRFVPVNTGDQSAFYIFGEPAKVKQVLDKYHL